MHDSNALRCIYCLQLIAADDDAQKVSTREVAHTACAFAVDAAGWATLDAEEGKEEEADASQSSRA
jgi:hypothetical protein